MLAHQILQFWSMEVQYTFNFMPTVKYATSLTEDIFVFVNSADLVCSLLYGSLLFATVGQPFVGFPISVEMKSLTHYHEPYVFRKITSTPSFCKFI